MMRSLFAGVSGLRNHQIRLDVIGNNIANVNTVGFKAGRLNFQEVFNQTIRGAASPQGGRGGTNPQQIGLGMSVASIDTVQTQGNLQISGKMTDLAVQGAGFFMLGEAAAGQKPEPRYYTRDGSFDLDSEGYLIQPANGLKVLGWMADDQGALPVKDKDNLGFLQVAVGRSKSPTATTTLRYSHNLEATATPGSSFVTSVDVYDSLGNIHSVTMNFQKGRQNTFTGDGSTVTFTLSPLPVLNGTEVVTVNGVTKTRGVDYNINYATGQVTFTTAPAAGDSIVIGYMDGQNRWYWTASWKGTAVGSGDLDFSNSGAFVGQTGGPITFTPTNPDAATLSITPDFSKLTSYASASTASATYRDGYPMGALETFTIDSTGTITGVYSNGLTQVIGQVALASFSNPGGLIKAGENLYTESNNSGIKQVGEAATGGRGRISPGTLEMANVDLSQEFTSMIVTQRGFQANSRVITTSDEMLQELVNLKR